MIHKTLLLVEIWHRNLDFPVSTATGKQNGGQNSDKLTSLYKIAHRSLTSFFLIFEWHKEGHMYSYVSPHFCGETYCFCPVRPSVRHTICQRNSSETTEQNFMKLGR